MCGDDDSDISLCSENEFPRLLPRRLYDFTEPTVVCYVTSLLLGSAPSSSNEGPFITELLFDPLIADLQTTSKCLASKTGFLELLEILFMGATIFFRSALRVLYVLTNTRMVERGAYKWGPTLRSALTFQLSD